MERIFWGQWARQKVETRAEDTTVVRAEDYEGTRSSDRKDRGQDDSEMFRKQTQCPKALEAK